MNTQSWPHQPQYYIIEHVEAVIYTNVDHTVKYEDQSKYILSMYDEYIGMQNEIARLRAKLRDFGCEL